MHFCKQCVESDSTCIKILVNVRNVLEKGQSPSHLHLVEHALTLPHFTNAAVNSNVSP